MTLLFTSFFKKLFFFTTYIFPLSSHHKNSEFLMGSSKRYALNAEVLNGNFD